MQSGLTDSYLPTSRGRPFAHRSRPPEQRGCRCVGSMLYGIRHRDAVGTGLAARRDRRFSAASRSLTKRSERVATGKAAASKR